MAYRYKDVFDFQRKHPTKWGRERMLRKLSSEEIMHLANTCGIAQGGIYYERFAEQARFRELIGPVSKDLERVWQEGLCQSKEEIHD